VFQPSVSELKANIYNGFLWAAYSKVLIEFLTGKRVSLIAAIYGLILVDCDNKKLLPSESTLEYSGKIPWAQF
jgi:hypothetical protein